MCLFDSQQKMELKILTSNWFFYILLFLGFFTFYAQVHPIVPFDTDDWINMGIARPFYPSWSQWNPTKIFPECLESSVATTASYIATLFKGDYLTTLIHANSTVVSLFILLYLFSIQRLLESRYKISRIVCFCIILFYILLHFLILRTSDTNNDYLLYAHDGNCYYHYVIPNMLCASLVLWLMRHDINELKVSVFTGIFVLSLYLALCSNLYSTVILIAYIGSVLLLKLFECKKNENKWIVSYIKQNSVFIIIVVLWLIVQFIEAMGTRANSYGYLYAPIKSLVKWTTINFITIHYNLFFISLAIVILVFAKIYNFRHFNKKVLHIGKQQIVLFGALFLSIVYLILLSSRVNPDYIKQGNVIFSYIFFFILILVLCIGYLCQHIKATKYIIPFLLFVVYFEINAKTNVFMDVQHEYGENAQTCLELDREFINQICAADAAGKDTVVINVPNYGSWDNWPLAFDCQKFIGLTLHKHGITKRVIHIIYNVAPAEKTSEE